MPNTSAVTTLIVALGERAYPIHIGAGQLAVVLAEIERLLAEKRRVFVVTTPALRKIYSAFFQKTTEIGVIVHETSCDGEQAKRVGELECIWEALAAARLDRTSVVVAFGGGVIGDLAGFSAASYLRGIDFIQVPTTLLAMVDSAVGGKTGINLAAGKNLAGAFHQPQAVFSDMAVLGTLPAREFAAGMGEVIKYGMLGDRVLFDKLVAAGPLHWQHPLLPEIIRRCCEIKAEIVRDDEHETAKDGGRALLNLGHTFAHAIENVAGYGEYLHGEAVAIGLMLAARLSVSLDLLDAANLAPIEALISANNLPVRLRASLPMDDLLEAMRRDKKVRHGALRFVVMKSIGLAETLSVDDESLVRRIWASVMPG
ncbi:MAG: 3-dehydroquinate synthase [Puniceicoccales bacterium]|jgi:3-dehydroquinate synthase|nr:3-dehydroquinate synthase [Puniceicoccales bacterium]